MSSSLDEITIRVEVRVQRAGDLEGKLECGWRIDDTEGGFGAEDGVEAAEVFGVAEGFGGFLLFVSACLICWV